MTPKEKHEGMKAAMKARLKKHEKGEKSEAGESKAMQQSEMKAGVEKASPGFAPPKAPVYGK